MATKPDAAKSDADTPVKAPPNSRKKRLLIGGVVFLVLALAGGGAWFFLGTKSAVEESADTPERVAPKGPPTFLPLENMVVNLADPGGDKVAQIGITLELADSKGMDKVKMYLPSIRSGILLLISQRTAEELLQIEGKEKLAADILLEASRPFADADVASGTRKLAKDGAKVKKKSVVRGAGDEIPVRAVLFSSFIVQ